MDKNDFALKLLYRKDVFHASGLFKGNGWKSKLQFQNKTKIFYIL